MARINLQKKESRRAGLIRKGRVNGETMEKIGKVHQNILTFYKGNPDKIRDIFNDNIKFN